MKKVRFTEEQMVAILREADRSPVPDVARKHKVSEQTIYVWRRRRSILYRLSTSTKLERSGWLKLGTSLSRITPRTEGNLARLARRPERRYRCAAGRARTIYTETPAMKSGGDLPGFFGPFIT